MNITWPAGETVPDPCPVCATAGPHPVLLRAGPHVLLRCTGCTACFYQDRTPPDYADEVFSAMLQQLYLEQGAGLFQITQALSALDDSSIDSVLDVGCGFGFPVDMAANVLGWRACGLDPSHHAREGARLLRADIRKEYLTADSDLGEPFALVMGSEVIEHIPDPYAFLAVLRRWVRPGGVLALSTPDAGALSPALGTGSLVPMLSAGSHLILYSTQAAEHLLRRAGFAHVHVRVEPGSNTVLAWASDRPLRFRADAHGRHIGLYRAYLRHLVDTAEPGTPLWNGGAGRLFALDAISAEAGEAFGLWNRIAAAWRDRFGLDLARPARLDAAPEAEINALGLERLAQRQPLNLAGVLLGRAVLANRLPGRDPRDVLDYARPAHIVATRTRRLVQGAGMDDLDLKQSAWRARMMLLDCMIELAPELQGELLAALAQPSPGALADGLDPPPEVVAARIAPFFTAMVHAVRYDEALRLEPFLRNLDVLCAALAHDPGALLHGLFTIGVLRLNALHAPGPAREAFQRMADEASARLDQPEHAPHIANFLDVARQHIAMATAGLPPPRKRARRTG